jgi:Ku70/Ku80 beta-barrel domain
MEVIDAGTRRKTTIDVPGTVQKLSRNIRKALLRMQPDKMYHFLERVSDLQQQQQQEPMDSQDHEDMDVEVPLSEQDNRPLVQATAVVKTEPGIKSEPAELVTSFQPQSSEPLVTSFQQPPSELPVTSFQQPPSEPKSPQVDQGSRLVHPEEMAAAPALLRSAFAVPYEKDRIREHVDFCGYKVPLSATDKALIADSVCLVDYGSLSLIGFRDENSVAVHQTLERALFAYPNEDLVLGSTVAFAHLHSSMLRKRVVAFGELVNPKATYSQFVVIRPVEADEEATVLKRPPGFILNVLPCEDEMREFGADAASEMMEAGEQVVSDEMMQAARQLIKKQTIKDIEIGEDLVNVS